MSDERVRVRLLFVDEGSYHHEVVSVPAASLGAHDRLIDALREDPEVLERLHVDVGRLCAASLVEAGEASGAETSDGGASDEGMSDEV